MNIIEQAAELARHFEGLRLKRYLDPVGIPTLGYGHIGHGLPETCTEEQAEAWLKEDLTEALAHVDRLGLQLKEHERAALTDAVFNLGPRCISASTGLGKALRAGSWSAVPGQLKRWNKAGGRVSPGLVRRRQAEAHLWQTGEYPAPAPAPSRVLKRGDRGPEVEELQRALDQIVGMVEVDGEFGHETQGALMRLQIAYGLKPDGVYGKESRAALAKALEEKGTK